MNQNVVSQKIEDLTQKLVSLEGASEGMSTSKISAAHNVSEKLRRPLSTVTGVAGFRSLLARALTLAKRDEEFLNAVQIKEDGSLQGLNEDATQAGVTLIAHLIGLLETFIGEALTMRLLREIWTDLPDSSRDFDERNKDERTQSTAIRQSSSETPGLDEILGEGFLGFSFNILTLRACCCTVAEASSIPIAEIDGAERIVRYVNPAFCLLTGRAKEQLLGNKFSNVVTMEKEFVANLDHVYETGDLSPIQPESNLRASLSPGLIRCGR